MLHAFCHIFVKKYLLKEVNFLCCHSNLICSSQKCFNFKIVVVLVSPNNVNLHKTEIQELFKTILTPLINLE